MYFNTVIDIVIDTDSLLELQDNQNMIGFRVVGVEDSSSRTACHLLVIAIEHIDSLLSEWFSNLDTYTNIQGIKAVRRVGICTDCIKVCFCYTEFLHK